MTEIPSNFFDQTQVDKLEEGFLRLDLSLQDFVTKTIHLTKLVNPKAEEFFKHGFIRRIMLLRRCVQNIYDMCPPSNLKKLTHDERKDIEINLQSFVFNIFGCLDNLAWVWACETDLKDDGKPIKPKYVGLMPQNKLLINSFSKKTQDYLNQERHIKWCENLINFRHALAHRIPLYVPPFSLTPDEGRRYNELDGEIWVALKNKNFELYEHLSSEQEALGKFLPLMTHSFSEKAVNIVFHAQVLADSNTITELSRLVLGEIQNWQHSTKPP